MPLNIISHIQLEWEIPECRRWYGRLAQNRRLVRYDTRGMGLSQRGVTDLSIDAIALDLDAVVERLGVERFDLFGLLHSAPAAIAYAARRPERVSHLLLLAAYARVADVQRLPQIQALRSLMDKDWTFYTETMAHQLLGWSEGEPARRYAELVREAITPELLRQSVAAVNAYDVAALLSQVASPTLLLHRRGYIVPIEVTWEIAAGIPTAQVSILEGESGAPYLGDVESVLSASSWGAPGAPRQAASLPALPPSCSRTSRTPPPSRSAWATRRPRSSSARTTRSCARPCLHRAGRRSNTPATASWRLSQRPRAR